MPLAPRKPIYAGDYVDDEIPFGSGNQLNVLLAKFTGFSKITYINNNLLHQTARSRASPYLSGFKVYRFTIAIYNRAAGEQHVILLK